MDPIFKARLLSEGLPLPVTEYRFGAMASGGGGKGLRARLKATGLRDWKMDYAWPDQKVALEVDGGVWIPGGGRHTRGKGWEGDTEKLNAAAVLGWRMLRCQPRELTLTKTIIMIGAALRG